VSAAAPPTGPDPPRPACRLHALLCGIAPGGVSPDHAAHAAAILAAADPAGAAAAQMLPKRGIGAATAWVFEQMQAIAATSSGRMTVQKQTFVQPVSNRIPVPTTITNVIATLQGTTSPERFYVVTGHLDSRVTDVLDFTSDAPGADDDASGVAVVLELARLFATRQFAGTLVFATVAGEEQGLYGSTFMAAQMAAAGADVQGMFSNDIVGASQAWDGTQPDPQTLRLFVERIPTAVTSGQISIMQAVGGENDGVSRQLGRFVADVAPFELIDMNIRVIWRRDRYLRASDHVSFQGQGYPAARFTEPRENFNHEHQNTQVVNGVQFGDLIQFVDFGYIARVVKVNAAALWALATGPGIPKNVQIHAPVLIKHHSHLGPQPRAQPGRVRGRDAGDHVAGLDRRDQRRQCHHRHAQHRQGQCAIRPARRRQGGESQSGRIPAGSDLLVRPANRASQPGR
jgi:hypothetical protein